MIYIKKIEFKNSKYKLGNNKKTYIVKHKPWNWI